MRLFHALDTHIINMYNILNSDGRVNQRPLACAWRNPPADNRIGEFQMGNRTLFCLLTVVVFILCAGCGGGGGEGKLTVGSVQGPASVNEGASAQYSVTASGDTGITYQWACNPSSAGSFTNGTSATCTFTAATVSADTSVTVSVTVTSDNDGPEVAQLSITVVDVPVAPNTGWAQTWGGVQIDRASSVVIDASNTIYVAGRFTSATDLDPGTGTDLRQSNGQTDVFLCRYDTSGNLVWGITWGGGGHDEVTALATDAAGNIYVTGYFMETVDFDPGTGVETRNTNGDSDVFISKFDAAGTFLNVITWGGLDSDSAQSIATDPATGDVYAAGSFAGATDFDPGPGNTSLISHGDLDAFLVKYNSAGVFQWARHWGGSDEDRASGLALDSSGDIWTVGEYRNTVDFDPDAAGTDEHAAFGSPDGFLSRIDSSGTFVMANTWGGPGTVVTKPNAVSINGSGDVFVAGSYSKTVDFEPGTGVDEYTSNGGLDVFLSRYDSAGGYNWTATWGGVNDDEGFAVLTDNADDVCVTGDFRDTVDFDPGTAVENRNAVNFNDIFVNKLDSAGSYIWTRTPGSMSEESGLSLACDSSDNIYIVGRFFDTIDFDPGAGVDEHTPNGFFDDCFLLKYLPDGSW